MNRLTPADVKTAVFAGTVGSVALAVIHESARQVVPHPPRTDVLGARANAAVARRLGLPVPTGWTAYGLALSAGLSSNGLIYATVGLGDRRSVYRRGLVIGLLTGLTAWLLPPAIGLGRVPNRRAPWTELMTVTWYTLGGLAAAAAAGRVRS